MICHAQHSALNHIYTLWFSIVILFGIRLIVGLLRAGGQVQALKNERKLRRQSEGLTNCAVYVRSEMWQRREAAGNGKSCFERKRFESLLVDHCFHLSDFFPLHNKKRCWLPSLPGVWCSSFPHSTAVWGRIAESSDFGLELALACLNILLITTEWWCIQISSILRGQVPFPKKILL